MQRMAEAIFKKHFSSSYRSRGRRFCSDVRCTLLGIKPAILIDDLPPDAGKIQLFVQEFIHLVGFAGDANVFLLSIGEDVLIVNNSSLSHLVTTSSPPILLDVTKGNDQPMIMDDSKRESIISYCLKMLPKRSPGYISPTEVAVPIYTIPCSIPQMSPTVVPSPFLPPVHVCSEAVSILNLCTMFGYLLHYPVVYWFDSERGHCLDMEDLVQYKVKVSYNKGEKAEQVNYC